MAVGDEASLRPTNHLLLKEGRKHYRTQISPIHWQLRSLISAERDGIVVFPAGINNTHITRFDTRTRECETIKVINFHPRCLVASGRWICCGGEGGEFAIISEAASSSSLSTADTTAHSVEPANVPTPAVASAVALASATEHALDRNPTLAAEPSMAELRRDMLNIVEQMSGSAKTWSVTYRSFGDQRVNCITIWQPPKMPCPARPQHCAYSFPVAILANNDKTISIVDLGEADIIDELQCPDCVNRGVISPDGSLLVAICDDPFLYVHVRCASPGQSGLPYEWAPLPRIRLQDQSVRDTSDCRGSFAACFSHSGKYLAVGTQYGTISIFDVAAFADPARDPLVTYFSSARAPSDNGAVRDMAFSPGPYDLLAWTEHRGRIGVADARTNFTKRQIISIEEHELFDHFSLNERSTTIDPRLLDPRSERSVGSSSTNLAGSPSRSQLAIDNNSEISRLNPPFSQDETAILEAIQQQGDRQRARDIWHREHRDRDSQTTRSGGSAAWRSSAFAERLVPPQIRPPGSVRDRDRDRDRERDRERDRDRDRDRDLSISDRLRYLTSLQRDTLQRIFERDQSRDHPRSTTGTTTTIGIPMGGPTTGTTATPMAGPALQTPPTLASSEGERERRAPTPRRRSSIMQALAQNMDNASRVQSTSRDYSSLFGTSGRNTSGWSDLEALYNLSGGDAGYPAATETTASRFGSNRIRRAIPIIGDAWNDEISGLRRYGHLGNREHQQRSEDTAGLTWSEDGRTLYIGAEDGIYEFQMNVLSRKLFPAVTFR
ncbi:hypothetical protein F4808DRAFT_358966 [Astrocystis sublimbata]|nr:hypothetical protein F4808DRAFT_358966 [Astrocystis sublimbata]